jgi:tetratricopeptide (TPR) repeat protein
LKKIQFKWEYCVIFLLLIALCWGKIPGVLVNIFADYADNHQSEKIYKQLIFLQKIVHGQNSLDYAESLDNLGTLYFYNKKRYKEANKLFKQALEIRKKAIYKAGIDASLTNMTLLFQAEGKYREAENTIMQVITINKDIYGQDYEDLAYDLSNLAHIYKVQGKLSEAIKTYRESISIMERKLGSNNPDNIISLTNLGGIYLYQGKYKEAESAFKTALIANNNNDKYEYPDIIDVLAGLTWIYTRQGKYNQAKSFLLQELSLYEKHKDILNKDDILKKANALKVIGNIYTNQNKPDFAKNAYNQAKLEEKIANSKFE